MKPKKRQQKPKFFIGSSNKKNLYNRKSFAYWLKNNPKRISHILSGEYYSNVVRVDWGKNHIQVEYDNPECDGNPENGGYTEFIWFDIDDAIFFLNYGREAYKYLSSKEYKVYRLTRERILKQQKLIDKRNQKEKSTHYLKHIVANEPLCSCGLSFKTAKDFNIHTDGYDDKQKEYYPRIEERK